MSSLAVNPLMATAKPSLLERTHYSGPSGTIHHSHHSSSKGSGKHSIALTALTLLSFLFFLNILQNCIQEHMQEMNSTQQVVIVQARTPEERQAQKRKGDEQIFNATAKTSKETRMRPSQTTDRYMTQIPVKLRTNEKAVRP